MKPGAEKMGMTYEECFVMPAHAQRVQPTAIAARVAQPPRAVLANMPPTLRLFGSDLERVILRGGLQRNPVLEAIARIGCWASACGLVVLMVQLLTEPGLCQ